MANCFRALVVSVALLGQVGLGQQTDVPKPLAQQNQVEEHSSQQLADQNAMLRKELAKLLAREESRKHMLQSEAFAEAKAREAARNKQMQSLNDDLSQLKDREDTLRQETGGISSPAAIDRMAERLAEAQIENRLRLLEAQAMVQVLEQNRTVMESKVQEQAKFAIQQAEILVKQRQIELSNVAKLKEKGFRNDSSVAELELKKAELFLQQAKYETEASIATDVDRQLIDAAIELAVSQRLEQFLQKEVTRVNSILVAGSDFVQIKIEVEALRNELVELKLRAYEEKKEIEARQTRQESDRMEQEILFPLQIRRRLLLDSAGKGHPSLKAVETEIEIVERRLEELRRDERAVSKNHRSK